MSAAQTPNEDLEIQYVASRARATGGNFPYNFPLWLAILLGGWALILLSIVGDPIYSNIFNQLGRGIPVTLETAIKAYIMALIIGLVIGLIRSEVPQSSKSGGIMGIVRYLVYQLATLYVEIMRGLPILIVLLLTAFVLFPAIRDDILEPLLGYEIQTRGGSPEPAIIALGLLYGAFTSETIRAGIQSIERGQMEAAKSLGMTYTQSMRFIILPQALRRVLPPLGNDIIAMLKDSSLVSALGVADVTYIARTSSAASFRYLETYLTVAFIYLTLTVAGSFIVRIVERRSKQRTR